MAWYFTVSIFILSCFILSWLSSRLINSLIQIGRYLKWREFVIAFFIMAFAVSLPNLFVDMNAVFHGIPEVALGDIIGGNLVDLTLALGVAVFFTKKGFSADNKMVQKSAVFTAAIAVLPLLLIWDGKLERMDGVILISAFLFYTWWLFSEQSHFKKVYTNAKHSQIANFRGFVFSIIKVAILLILLLAASQAVIQSAQFFSTKLGISLSLVGILIVGLGNAFPEIYFSIISARKEENYLVLGDLMGSVIVCATLVLGLIGLIYPFQIHDLNLFLAARTFLIIAAAFSLLFIITNKRVSKKEGLFLLFIYIAFLLVEVFLK